MSFPSPTNKQAKIIWSAVTGLGIAVLVALIGALIWTASLVLKVLSPVLWPLAIAGILAYLLDPVVDWFERRKVPRRRAIIMVFILFAALIINGLGNLVPRLVFESRNLIERMPGYVQQMQKNTSEWMAGRPFLFYLQERVKKMLPSSLLGTATNATAADHISNPPVTAATNAITLQAPPPSEQALASNAVDAIFKWLSNALPALGQWLLIQLGHLTSWFEMLIGLALIPVFLFYFLLEKKGIESEWTHYLPMHESKFKDELVFVLNAINNYLIVFFRAQVVVAMCDGIMLSVGFLLMGLNFAVLIGMAAGFLGIIPYLGTILTIVPAIILAAVQFQDWWHPILVIAIYSLVHMIEGFVISPKIQGDRVGLHPLTIIVALLVGTNLLGGILGGILAIPLTAALRVIMFRYIWVKKPVEATQPETAVTPTVDLQS